MHWKRYITVTEIQRYGSTEECTAFTNLAACTKMAVVLRANRPTPMLADSASKRHTRFETMKDKRAAWEARDRNVDGKNGRGSLAPVDSSLGVP